MPKQLLRKSETAPGKIGDRPVDEARLAEIAARKVEWAKSQMAMVPIL